MAYACELAQVPSKSLASNTQKSAVDIRPQPRGDQRPCFFRTAENDDCSARLLRRGRRRRARDQPPENYETQGKHGHERANISTSSSRFTPRAGKNWNPQPDVSLAKNWNPSLSRTRPAPRKDPRAHARCAQPPPLTVSASPAFRFRFFPRPGGPAGEQRRVTEPQWW